MSAIGPSTVAHASREIVGWAMAVTCTLNYAVTRSEWPWNRGPLPGLILHSDRGVQYASGDYRKIIHRAKLIQSMSRKGECLGFKLVRASGSNDPGDRLKAQNAPMESFFSSLKKELVHRHRFGPREQAKAAIFGYIEVFYGPPTPPFSHRLPDTGSGVHRDEMGNGRV
ncbi:IS3 family transposase [Palleronia caenipelagi]|uniref:IS3 family transposase n=1 Tax=Palleronia caenipelagi TaxID=2489174 RepID=UPI001C8F6AA4|nr:IS3 family transposase [Palleronia caenipelagi]